MTPNIIIIVMLRRNTHNTSEPQAPLPWSRARALIDKLMIVIILLICIIIIISSIVITITTIVSSNSSSMLIMASEAILEHLIVSVNNVP